MLVAAGHVLQLVIGVAAIVGLTYEFRHAEKE